MKLQATHLSLMKSKNFKNEAFAPLSQHPIFGGVLYPFGGIGFLVLMSISLPESISNNL